MTKFDLYFAGLARDCEDTLESNIHNVVRICSAESVKNCRILIAENDSVDDTRQILQRFAEEYQNLNPIFLDGIDERFPVREQRIAYLRNYIFNEIKNISKNIAASRPKLYVPLDLDSKIAQSIDTEQFIKECQRVANEETDAVFPVSEPYYYDIYALRAKGWVEGDCWSQVRRSRKQKGSFIAKINHVYSKQKSIEQLRKKSRISVKSAFGGVGIYNLDKLCDANYKQDGNYPRDVCEHIIFNKSIKSKEISTDFVVRAPREHIKYNTSILEKLKIFVTSALSDIKYFIRD